MQENPLWAYSLKVYDKPGVQPLLLQLQDNFGADINLLLGCCWLAADNRAVTDDDLSALIKVSAKWRAECLMPLRAVRRFLKTQQQAESIYQRAKMLELDAERWQQDQMYQWLSVLKTPLSELPDKEQLALYNLQQYCARLPGVDWAAVAPLVSELVVLLGMNPTPGPPTDQ